jgi:CRP-like cAMP-binding protein
MVSQERIYNAIERFHFHSGIDFDKLPPEDQEFINSKIKIVKLKKKQVLYRQGNNPAGIYIIKKGRVKVYQLNYDGSIQILFIYTIGEIFGYRPIISHEVQPVSVAALEDCEFYFLPKTEFLTLLENSSALSKQLLISLSHEFTVLTNRINVFAQRGIKERLALALLILNHKFKMSDDHDGLVEIKLNRTDLANFVGTSLENLIRTINFFKERKLITTKGKNIYIQHLDNLFILSSID